MHLLVGFRLLIATIRSFYKLIVNVRYYSGVIGKLSIKQKKTKKKKKNKKKNNNNKQTNRKKNKKTKQQQQQEISLKR